MTVRPTALALSCAATLASVCLMANSAAASTDAWRFVAQYPSMTACAHTGKTYVARHMARTFKCENDYTGSGAPTLDLYVR